MQYIFTQPVSFVLCASGFISVCVHSKRSECEPVRTRHNFSFSSRYIKSQSGFIWHSLWCFHFPPRSWSRCLAERGVSFTSLLITARKSSLSYFPDFAIFLRSALNWEVWTIARKLHPSLWISVQRWSVLFRLDPRTPWL